MLINKNNGITLFQGVPKTAPLHWKKALNVVCENSYRGGGGYRTRRIMRLLIYRATSTFKWFMGENKYASYSYTPEGKEAEYGKIEKTSEIKNVKTKKNRTLSN